MAVVNKYTFAEQQAQARGLACGSAAMNQSGAMAPLDVVNGDSATSVYRLIRDVPCDLIPKEFLAIINAGIAGGTSFDFGIAATSLDGSATILANLFSSTNNLSAVGMTDLLAGVARGNVGLNIKELYKAVTGTDLRVAEVDLVLTMNNNATGNGGGRIVGSWLHN